MREPIKPEVIHAVEEFALPRIVAPTNKQILAKFPNLSQTTLTRILRTLRKRVESDMTKDRQRIES